MLLTLGDLPLVIEVLRQTERLEHGGQRVGNDLLDLALGDGGVGVSDLLDQPGLDQGFLDGGLCGLSDHGLQVGALLNLRGRGLGGLLDGGSLLGRRSPLRSGLGLDNAGLGQGLHDGRTR